MAPQPKSIYEKILQAEKESTIQEIVDKENSRKIRVHMPCKVIRVRKNNVDVEIQGMEDSGFGYHVKFPQLLDLPVIYNNYTSKAYIVTPIQVGDTGLVEFLDFNASGFSDNGNTAISSDQFPHSLNNGVFINGYIPDNRVMIDIADNEAILIGLHNTLFKLSVDNTGTLKIDSKSDIIFNTDMGVTFNSPKTDFSGSVNIGIGASGAFSTGDGKTITVVNGIITNIGD